MSSHRSSPVSLARPPRPPLLSCEAACGSSAVAVDPYDLSTLTVALRSDDSSGPSLPQPSSLSRAFHSERPSRLSASPLSRYHPSPSSSPHSSPSSPAVSDPRAIQLSASADTLPASTAAPATLPHCAKASVVPFSPSSLFPSPVSSPVSASSTVTCTPSSSASSFSSPSSVFFSPFDPSSSQRFLPLHSPSLASVASLSAGSPSAATAASPTDSAPPSHHSTPSPAHTDCTHRQAHMRRKRQLGGVEQYEDELQHRHQQQPQQPQQTTRLDVGAGEHGDSPLPSRFSFHRVLPPRPPRVSLRTLRVRKHSDRAVPAARPSLHTEQRTDSDECDGSETDDTEAEATAADITAVATMRSKRRRKWPFSPPLAAHTRLLSYSDPHTHSSPHPLPSVGAGAVSPLHRLRRLDPVISAMHTFIATDSTAHGDSHTSDWIERDALPQVDYPLAAISRQRQSVLDRLKALTEPCSSP